MRRFREVRHKEIREVEKKLSNATEEDAPCFHMEGPAPTITVEEARAFIDRLFADDYAAETK